MNIKKIIYDVKVTILSILIIFVVICSASSAATFYLNNTTGDDGKDGLSVANAWKTIGKANSTLTAGDTVYIMAGIYEEKIVPSNSGTSGNYITYARYNNDVVTITNVNFGADLRNRSYIVLDGLNIMNTSDHWVEMRPNGHHNIIRNCHMEENNAWSGLNLQDRADYNQILNNTLIGYCRPSDVILIWNSSYNLVEGNKIYYGTHNAIGVQDRGTAEYNIIRNNYIENKWHRGISISTPSPTLIEGNTIVNCGSDHLNNSCGTEADRTAPTWGHSGFTNGAQYTIARNNIFINNGIALSINGTTIPSVHNRIYNNTVYSNYYARYTNVAGVNWDNYLVNNIFYDDDKGYHEVRHNMNEPDENYYVNNNILGADPPVKIVNDKRTIAWLEANMPAEWYDNLEVDPLFVNAVASPNASTSDLHLQSSSPMIDAGTWLTTITSVDGSGTSFDIDDATYFMDGWGIIDGDTIQLQGQTQTAKITNISGNTITIDTSLTWTSGQGVSLAYEGSAPDIGAYENSFTNISPPQNLRIIEP